MTLLSRFKGYVSKATAVAGSLFGSGYTDNRLAAERNSPLGVRIAIPTSNVSYPAKKANVSDSRATLTVDYKLDLTRDTNVLHKTLDGLVLDSDHYVAKLDSDSLTLIIDELGKKAGTIRDAYNLVDSDLDDGARKLAEVSNDLAGRLDRTANSLEKYAFNYDLEVIENGLTTDVRDVMRSLKRIEARAETYSDLMDNNKFSDLISTLKAGSAAIAVAYKGNDSVRPVLDMYSRAILSLKSVRSESEKSEVRVDASRLNDSDQDPEFLNFLISAK